MPRVALNTSQRKKYKVRDLAGWIEGQRHMLGIDQKIIAQELGISQPALSSRLNPRKYKEGAEKDPFSYGDLLIIFKLFGTPEEEIIRLLKL